MSQKNKTFRSNAIWSGAGAGVLFVVLFGWVLYYAATAKAGTNANVHILGMPIVTVTGLSDGFKISTGYGVLALPVAFGAVLFAISLLFGFATRAVTRKLPQ